MEKGLEWASEECSTSTGGDIIRWWEGRRYAFNAVLLAVGFASWLLVMTAGTAAAKPGEDFEEPLAMLSGIFIYVVMANVCYTWDGLWTPFSTTGVREGGYTSRD
jgi:hypothetical protein